ncbi:potassium channel family protein [Daejeonella sp. H1SJ63]|uniref:potassium channel family protein n=1 Tax=Daejeonella sp. H1SJ63 TaxID=3034145 RepID=UPI0023EABE61|nr:potassium channel family protein [Daejeonella sp. H1SJ63]
MRKRLSKLVFGTQDPGKLNIPDSTSHFSKIFHVWNSSHYHDFGIERFVRLFLVSSKIFFPGIYIDLLTMNLSAHARKVSGELYVVFKTVMPFILLSYSLWDVSWLFIFNIYLLIETFIYIFHKIFLPEHNTDKLANRSVILLFLNFSEVIASFALIYASGHYFNQPLHSWIDALYFSLITGVTIGFGDIYPINDQGKILVMLQVMSTLSFMFLFFNFFTPREKDKL